MSSVTNISGFYELPKAIPNVSPDELRVIEKLLAVWAAKLKRNQIRSTYFDGKNPLKPTGNIPEEALSRVRAVLGWPAKAVTGLSQRIIFDGFVTTTDDQDPFELQGLLDDNRFDLEFPQATDSSLKHSCSFITTAKGDVHSGEPDVLIMARSAEFSGGLWDKRRRRVEGYVAVKDLDGEGRVSSFDAFLPDVVISCEKQPSGKWKADRRKNTLGEVLVEALPFDPQLDRPFGRSRISRAVMNITDRALMTIGRTEIGSDFFAVPRMLALGVAEDAFSKGKWQASIDRWFALTRDEEGELPDVSQLPQLTMQPLLEQYRMYASQFAGETGLPISSLGIVQDNPTSAEAMYAAEKDLVVQARATTRVFGGALRQVARKAVMIRDGLNEAPPELRGIRANWVNPAFTSPVTAADALVKLSGVFPWLGESEVALEYAGFTQAEITRLLADKRRSSMGSLIGRLTAAQDQGEAPQPASQPASQRET